MCTGVMSVVHMTIHDSFKIKHTDRHLMCGRWLRLPNTAPLVLASVLGKRMRLKEARSPMQVSGAIETRPRLSMSLFILW